jgi:hypothetical protein
VREGHHEGVEVPQDWAEGPQEVHVEDEVEAAQVDAGARDGEVLIANGEGHVLRQPMAAQAVAVGHGHAEIIAARWLEGETTHGGDGQEIMRGARVQQCHQALAVNHHRQEHRALMAYASQRVERDHKRLGRSGGGCGLGRCRRRQRGGRLGWRVRRGVVDHLQVEEAGADVVGVVGLVAVEAESETAVFDLLGRGKPAEGTRGRRGRVRWCSRVWPAGCRGRRRWASGRASDAAQCELLHCLGATLVGAGVVHRRLEVLGGL